MKRNFLVLILVLNGLFLTAQDYQQYLPTNLPDYLDENLYYMNFDNPTIIKIDPSGTDPEADYTNLKNITEAGSYVIPSNTFLLWKAGTTDTSDFNTLPWIAFKNDAHDVFIGRYGVGPNPRMVPTDAQSQPDFVHVMDEADRIWINGIDFYGSSTVWNIEPVESNPKYEHSFKHIVRTDCDYGNLIGDPATGVNWNPHFGWQDKIILTNVTAHKQANGVGPNSTPVTPNNNEAADLGFRGIYDYGLDTLVMYNVTWSELMREGVIGSVARMRAYNSDIGDVNYQWYYAPDHLSNAGGDPLQLSPGYVNGEWSGDPRPYSNYYFIGNRLDKSATGRKFIFINGPVFNDAAYQHPDSGHTYGNSAYFIDNFISPGKDTLGQDQKSNVIGLYARLDTLVMMNNYFSGKIANAGVWNPGDAPHISYTMIGLGYARVENNVFDSIGGFTFGGSTADRLIEVYNNTWINTPSYNQSSYILHAGANSNGGATTMKVKNNVVATRDVLNHPFIKNDNDVTYDTANNFVKVQDWDNWDSYFGFTDWENGNFRIDDEDSPLYNAGSSIPQFIRRNGGIHNFLDQDSLPRIQGGIVDIGAYEYPEGGQTNAYPIMEDQDFYIDENTANNSYVGTVEASDPDPEQTLTFSIFSGNTNGVLEIDNNSGELTVGNTGFLNFEQHASFTVTIKVQDNGAGSLFAMADITIHLSDVNESPEIEDQAYSIDANINNGESVGFVEATDPDEGQSISYSINDGNQDGVFQMNESTGEITIADNSSLDINSSPTYYLSIEVQDNGEDELTGNATISITILEVNTAPNIENQNFSSNENLGEGSSIGIVEASDPNAGQTISFSITSGNIEGAFEIDSETGDLTVANEEAIDFEVNPVFILTVEVEDDGQGNLTNDADITINLSNVNEAPIVNDQNFIVEESIGNGELVGIIEASDPDQGQELLFNITGGNPDGIFDLDENSGELTVVNSDELDFAQTSIYFIDIEVEDNGDGELTDVATIAVSSEEVNQAPSINDQSFTLEENCANGITIGELIATDPDAGQTLSFSIVSGNISNTFEIDEETGTLSVNNNEELNYEAFQEFDLVVEVQDNGIGNLTDEADITIEMMDVNEAPLYESQSFFLLENSNEGVEVGIVEVDDPDAGQTVTFSIISGNIDQTFGIDESDGTIYINNAYSVNFEEHPLFYLVLEMQDNGQGNLITQGVVTVNIDDVNETPNIDDQYFTVEEESPEGTIVGEVLASDPDIGQWLTYTIVSGNIQDALEINPSTGVITVQYPEYISTAVNPVFILTVEVTDNGQGNLYSEAAVVVAVTGSTGVGEWSTINEFDCQVYPNPSAEYIHLEFDNAGKEELVVHIMNSQGQLVYTKEYQNTGNSYEDVLNINSWNNGVYMIMIKYGDTLTRKKLIKL